MNNNDEDRTATAGDEVTTDASTPESSESTPAESTPTETAPAAAEPSNKPEAVTFSNMGLAPAVAQAVKDVGYEVPSAIQEATIPLVLAGRDVVGLAQTGTGKTAAFALPILSLIDPALKKPQALILAPTRELALQVAEACISTLR